MNIEKLLYVRVYTHFASPGLHTASFLLGFMVRFLAGGEMSRGLSGGAFVKDYFTFLYVFLRIN